MASPHPAWTPEQAREAVAAYERTGLLELARRLRMGRPELRRRLVEAGAVIRSAGAATAGGAAAKSAKMRERHASDDARAVCAENGRRGMAKRFGHLAHLTPAERADYDLLTGPKRVPADEAWAMVRRGRAAARDRADNAARGGA